ncbi:uncharacterized protein LTHEOB_303 [Lasiodiplodia theobromae]|uniref:uncharacterized protein n=1 Tax=Lasiodiplodia theobromae TaxID=45133 RepID=UPI0015C381D6|nr:uncharacterized protein LTHEOB_303 [Lasiodiplodia theobromae]KAF4543604.1 hypothetical protein LTHEOB_303 [Lasiodiplodia theobromae]
MSQSTMAAPARDKTLAESIFDMDRIADETLRELFSWDAVKILNFKEHLLSRYQSAAWLFNNGTANFKNNVNRATLREIGSQVMESWAEDFGNDHGLTEDQLRYIIEQVLREKKNHYETSKRDLAKQTAKKRTADNSIPVPTYPIKRVRTSESEEQQPQPKSTRQDAVEAAVLTEATSSATGMIKLSPDSINTIVSSLTDASTKLTDNAAIDAITARITQAMNDLIRGAVKTHLKDTIDDHLDEHHPVFQRLIEFMENDMTNTMETSAKSAMNNSMEKVMKKSMKKVMKKSIEKVMKKSMEKVMKKSMEKAIEKAMKTAMEKTMEKTVEKAIKKAMK